MGDNRMILEGIRVVDCSVELAGPTAARMLADLGADVIHVEEVGKGDIMRGLKTIFSAPLELPEGRHVNFEEVNYNKRGITVDLHKSQGKEIIYRLIEKSDVFVSNLRPSARKRFGIDYETLSKYNQRLIYASATGFGEKGPEAESGAFDMLMAARSGIMMSSGEVGMPPTQVAIGMADELEGICLSWGIIAALLAREKLGVGQEVSTSGLAGLISLQRHILVPLFFGRELLRHSRAKAHNPLHNFYKCKDDRWIALCVVFDKDWPIFCEAVGMPQWATSSKFESADKRAENSEEMVSLLDEVFATKIYEEWEKLFRGKIFFAPVNKPSDLASDVQVITNEYMTEWDHPSLGRVKFTAFPVKFGKTPATIRRPAPQLGEHTEEVLLEVCGYTWDEISELRELGAI
jgi:CoA:oxalate CoA-transferase